MIASSIVCVCVCVRRRVHVRTLRMSCAERTQGFLASGKRSFVCQGLHNDSRKKIKGGLNVATVQRCSLVAGQDCKAAGF